MSHRLSAHGLRGRELRDARALLDAALHRLNTIEASGAASHAEWRAAYDRAKEAAANASDIEDPLVIANRGTGQWFAQKRSTPWRLR